MFDIIIALKKLYFSDIAAFSIVLISMCCICNKLYGVKNFFNKQHETKAVAKKSLGCNNLSGCSSCKSCIK